MKESYKKLADMIFERGAFKFGAFELKHHEKFPNDPLSPFFIHLRTKDNPKPGPLTDDDCDLIADALWEKVLESDLHFEAIAGLPYAADPIIAAIERKIPKPRGFRIIKLAKKISKDKREIIPLPGFDYKKGERILLFDDLITKGNSKIEAIKAIESQGSIVNDLIVLIDREQGGREEIKKAGYNLVACFTITVSLDYYKEVGAIDEDKHKECLDYVKNV